MIAVFGLGIVGLVTATGLVKRGFSVIGVDSNKNRISALKAGKLPFFEPELKAEIVTSSKKGLGFSESYSPDPNDTVIICVGTPSLKNGIPISSISLALHALRLGRDQNPCSVDKVYGEMPKMSLYSVSPLSRA